MDFLFRVISGLIKSDYILSDHQSVIVGRSEEEAQWVIKDPDISRRHLRLAIKDHSVWVEDLDSTNGVYVNKHKISVMTRLEDTDVILVGQTSVTFTPLFASNKKSTLSHNVSHTRSTPINDVQTSLMIPGLDAQELPNLLQHAELHKKLEVLYRIGSAGSMVRDLNEYYDYVFSQLQEHLQYRKIVAFYLNDTDYEIIHYKTSEEPLDLNEVSQTIIELCVENQQVVSSNFAQEDGRFKSSESLRYQVPLAVLCAPLLVSGKTLGVVFLDAENQKKMFTVEDIMLFSACAANLAWALSHNLALKQIVEKERKDSDLRIAREIQQNCILSPDCLPKIPGLEIASLYESYEIVGGDYYDVVPAKDSVVLVSADVAGKGVSAALIVSMLRAYSKTILQEKTDPAEILLLLHRLLENELPKKLFVTATFCTLDMVKREMSICRAGHTYLIHYRAKDKSVNLVGGKGIMIGVASTDVFKARLEKTNIRFESGDIILMYTDGLSEVRNSGNELFGDDRLAECVAHFSHLSAAKLLMMIQKKLAEFGGLDGFFDDMSAIVVKVE